MLYLEIVILICCFSAQNLIGKQWRIFSKVFTYLKICENVWFVFQDDRSDDSNFFNEETQSINTFSKHAVKRSSF